MVPDIVLNAVANFHTITSFEPLITIHVPALFFIWPSALLYEKPLTPVAPAVVFKNVLIADPVCRFDENAVATV
jgi:hypothetical protein